VTVALKEHAYAHIFPEMSEEDFKNLTASIEQLGQLTPILLYQGQIADGKHRYAAVKALSREPVTVEFKGTEEQLLDHVAAMNRDRRHLTPAQKAAVALELEPLYAKAGKDRESARKQGLAPAGASPEKGKAAKHAAKAAGASERSVERLKRVAAAPGGAALVAKVKAGKMSINEAEQKITKPEPASKNVTALFKRVKKALDTETALEALMDLKEQKYNVSRGITLVRELAGWLRTAHGVHVTVQVAKEK